MGEDVIVQIANFEKSLIKLKEVLLLDVKENDIVLDATIQRFEFTFENAWKAIKRLLKDQGEDVTTPRDCIRKAYRYGWIKDEALFLGLLKSRNLTSHTYKYEIAMDVYETVKNNVGEFDCLLEKLKKQL